MNEERYAIAYGESPDVDRAIQRLADAVHEYMGKGWTPLGGPIHVTYGQYEDRVHIYSQALVRTLGMVDTAELMKGLR